MLRAVDIFYRPILREEIQSQLLIQVSKLIKRDIISLQGIMVDASDLERINTSVKN